MIVKCTKVINEQTGELLLNSTWLTPGRTYPVLAIFMARGEPVKFRILGDDNVTPALHLESQFSIVSGILPSSWRIHGAPDRYIELAPASWLVDGFWESFFDREAGAIEVFQREYQQILDESEEDGPGY